MESTVKQTLTLRDRLLKIVDTFCGGSKLRFYSRVGLANGQIDKVSKVIRQETKIKILKAFPELNPGYLDGTENEIYKKGMKPLDNINKDSYINMLESLIKDKEEVIESQKDLIDVLQIRLQHGLN